MISTHDPPPPRLTSVRDKCWQRQLVAERDLLPQPWYTAVTGDRVGLSDLGDVLLARPGSYILKPRFGSNGVGVVRVVSDGDRLTAASDCPDTGIFLDEFPADPRRRGRDVVAAAATCRSRFVNRATAGLPEWSMGLSILEDEIRQDRPMEHFSSPGSFRSGPTVTGSSRSGRSASASIRQSRPWWPVASASCRWRNR